MAMKEEERKTFSCDEEIVEKTSLHSLFDHPENTNCTGNYTIPLSTR